MAESSRSTIDLSTEDFKGESFEGIFGTEKALSKRTAAAIEREECFGAHNYKSIPVVLEKGDGCYVWDVDGIRYLDFLSAYSAVSQGHCHPKIVDAVRMQLDRLTVCSRAFYSSRLGETEELLATTFKYHKVLMMNSGAEAVETGLKLARRWGYVKKQVPENAAVVIVVENNFHGRTIGIISFSTDPESKNGYGPYLPGFITIPFNDIESLAAVLEENSSNVVAFLVEPIQGEAGVIVPTAGYLKACWEICRQHNVLFIADEIQTGLGRCGGLTACEKENVRPDILLLGKALSGGILPASAVLADDDIMLTIKPGEHGSTFGGNSLACAATQAAVQVILDENLAARAEDLGRKLLNRLEEIRQKFPSVIVAVRGRGLLCAIDIVAGIDNAWKFCLKLLDARLLAKSTHETTIRFAPPLTILESQLDEACNIIEAVSANFLM